MLQIQSIRSFNCRKTDGLVH